MADPSADAPGVTRRSVQALMDRTDDNSNKIVRDSMLEMEMGFILELVLSGRA